MRWAENWMQCKSCQLFRQIPIALFRSIITKQKSYHISGRIFALYYSHTEAFKPESDFGTRIFCCDFVKILVNPSGFTAFCALHNKKFLKLQNSFDPKGVVFWVDFGEAKHIRLSPMCDNEPKDAWKPPFWAGSGLNASVYQKRLQNFGTKILL